MDDYEIVCTLYDLVVWTSDVPPRERGDSRLAATERYVVDVRLRGPPVAVPPRPAPETVSVERFLMLAVGRNIHRLASEGGADREAPLRRHFAGAAREAVRRYREAQERGL